MLLTKQNCNLEIFYAYTTHNNYVTKCYFFLFIIIRGNIKEMNYLVKNTKIKT